MSKYRKNRNRYKYDDDFAENRYDASEENPEEYPEEETALEEVREEETVKEEASGEFPEEGVPMEENSGSSPEEVRGEDGTETAAEEDPEDGQPEEGQSEEDPSSGGQPEEAYTEGEEYPEEEYPGEEYPEGEYPKEEYAEEEYPEEKYPGEEYPEEDYPEEEYEDEAIVRRRVRRRRRIRNQLLAYLCTLILILCIGACGYFAARKVISIVHGRKEQVKIDDQIEALSESEEEIVIEAPQIDDEEEEVKEVDYLAEIVEACISEMPIEDKIAQLFIVAPESITGANKVTQAGEKTKEALEKYAVGGFIYFGGNIVDEEQLTDMISTTNGYGKYRMFFAVDEEGGTCSRVSSSKIEVPDVGAMGAVGETGNPTKAFEAGQTIGTYLKEFGFNVDFAPVADIVTVKENSAIGDRSFGSDPQAVGQMVANCVQGIQGSGISACLKHFPGLGDTTEDTHKGRATITKTLDELQNANFESFRAGIEAGADFVMVGHATAENADDSGLPCSMSKNMITGQLRDYLGYDGIVITDALNMSAVTEYFSTEEICLKAFKAGVDILLMPDDFEKAYNALLEAVQSGSISEKRVDESLRRIFRVKFKNDIDNN